MTQYKVLGTQNVSSMCVVCGEHNEFSLHGHFYVLEGGIVYATLSPLSVHQSYPGRVHGGLVSAILDEVIGRAMNCSPEIVSGEEPERFGVTMDLNVRYRKPTPYDEPLYSIGRIAKETSRRIDGEGYLYTMDGTLLAQGTGRYIKLATDTITDKPLGEKDWHADSIAVPEYVDIPAMPKELKSE